MIYFSIPFEISQLNFLNFLANFLEDYPQYIKIKNSKIISYYGNFNYCYFNGLENNHLNNKIQLNSELKTISNNIKIPLRIDLSNIFLIEKNYFDIHMNIILKNFNGQGNYIDLIDKNLYSYCKEKYPFFFYNFSNNIELIQKLKITDINNLILSNQFELITLSENYVDFEEKNIDDIINKNKCEIKIDNYCLYCSYLQKQECLKKEQEFIYNYSSHSILNTCYYNNNFNLDVILLLIDKINKYNQQGFNYFKIQKPLNKDNKYFQLFFINLFIKNEYQYFFYNEYQKREFLK